jgi:hypothetical protein
MSRSRRGSNGEGESSAVFRASLRDKAFDPGDEGRDRNQRGSRRNLRRGMSHHAKRTVAMRRRHQLVTMGDRKRPRQRDQTDAQKTEYKGPAGEA